MTAAVLLALQILASQSTTAPSSQIGESSVVGVWKMCFEPGLPGVDEPSSGYLILMPGGRYYEMRLDCCENEEPYKHSGTYSVKENAVVISGWTTLRFVPSARVVLFDDLGGTPLQLPVLAHERSLNYGYARVYPVP